MQDYLKVVVTGEVDSGKSTLIGRLLYELGSLSREAVKEIRGVSQRLGSDLEFAYLLDSFEEERENQLTIDTTQVFCRTKLGEGFVFIDVPGHKELLKNMLSGASYADIAVLVIDVRKSVEEQTRRHAFILKFLGVEQIILALNKMDAVSFKEDVFKEVKENAVEFLKKTGIEPRYSIPVSAKLGDNLARRSAMMTWHKGLTLIEGLNSRFKKGSSGDRFRFLVQDIYDLGSQKVILGKIASGIIKKGEKVIILPLNKECRVKVIKTFNKDKSSATAPESIGLVLDDMKDIGRGSVICKGKERLPHVTTEIPAKFFCISPFSIKDSLEFRCATQEAPARVKDIKMVRDTATLEPNPKRDLFAEADVVEAVIVTGYPVVTEDFKRSANLGRFILKINTGICAVGIIC